MTPEELRLIRLRDSQTPASQHAEHVYRDRGALLAEVRLLHEQVDELTRAIGTLARHFDLVPREGDK